MMISIDLNCDLGEGAGNDHLLMPLVTSVNIACGGHAGARESMLSAIRLAKQYEINIGAHPGYDDRENFGRRELDYPAHRIEELIYHQTKMLMQLCDEENIRLRHVKPHGALYNRACHDREAAEKIVAAIRSLDPSLALIAPFESAMAQAANEMKTELIGECFIDRSYEPDGSLTSRSVPHAVLDTDSAIRQALDIVLKNQVRCANGKIIPIQAQTLCLHGDAEHAVATMAALRTAFQSHEITIERYPS